MDKTSGTVNKDKFKKLNSLQSLNIDDIFLTFGVIILLNDKSTSDLHPENIWFISSTSGV